MEKAAIELVFKQDFGPDRTRFLVDGEPDAKFYIFTHDARLDIRIIPGKRGRHERME